MPLPAARREDVGELVAEEVEGDDEEAEENGGHEDHVEVGAWMAERWQLPPELVGAIAMHHTAETPTGPHAALIASVYASNALVDAANQIAGKQAEPLVIDLAEPIRSALGIPDAGLLQLARELHEKRKQIEQLI